MLFGKYLQQKTTSGNILFYWYRVEVITILFFFAVLILVAYGIAGLIGLTHLGEMEVIPMKPGFAVAYWSFTVLIILFLIFDRRSTLQINKDGSVRFRKRPITSATQHFSKDDIIEVEKKLQKNYGETDGITRETYNLYVVVKSKKKIRIGSFNEADCNSISQQLSR